MDSALSYVAVGGVVLSVCSRAPLIVSAFRGRERVGVRATYAHAASRLCLLVYCSSQELWPAMLDSGLALLLDAAVLAAQAHSGQIRKSASGTELHLMATDT
jgi:hypothetical protein